MLSVRDDPGVLIKEGRSRLLERDTMLGFVGSALPQIPLVADVSHAYSVLTT
jgi:hypothetical protein